MEEILGGFHGFLSLKGNSLKTRIDAYFAWVRMIQRQAPPDRLMSILSYYSDGATIQVIKTLMSKPRKFCESMLQDLEANGKVGLVYWEATPEAVKARRRKKQEAKESPTPKKVWALKGL